MKLVIALCAAVLGTILIWNGISQTTGEAHEIGILALLLGLILVIAGLVGVKLADDDYARRVDGENKKMTSKELFSGLVGSLKELFIGPSK